ncbi:MAG TPA: response regulator [Polyangiaceae bacterium]|nr:response regulator [Polyangiaceae bacterium]
MAYAILMVDDSEIVIESLRRWLKLDGYEVVVATNCAEAMAAASRRRFAAHILDLELADGLGVDLALWLKREGHTAQTIFYTGHSFGNCLLEQAERVGHVVTKGASPHTLLRVLRTLVNASPEVRSPEHAASSRSQCIRLAPTRKTG